MIDGNDVRPDQVLELLEPFLSEDRLSRIREVVRSRTRTVVTVVEGAANTGNVSAVMRSAEGLGFLEFHLVTAAVPYKHSRRASQGAEKWLDVTTWESTATCLNALRAEGYTIVVTSPREDAVPLEEVDFTRKVALVFGNELEGVSAEAERLSDVVARVTLTGFVESYNISVAAALCLYHAYCDRIGRQGYHGDLPEAERSALTAHYAIRAVQRGEKILAESLRRLER